MGLFFVCMIKFIWKKNHDMLQVINLYEGSMLIELIC